MENNENTVDSAINCSSKFCGQPAVSKDPLSGLPFCDQHLNGEIMKLKNRHSDILTRLETVCAQSDRPSLRLDQQALVVEMQEVADMFDAAQETLQQWRHKLMSRVQQVHDSVAERLQDASQAEDCMKEIREIGEDFAKKDSVELLVSIESWLDEACSRSERFSQQRAALRDRQSRQQDGQAEAAAKSGNFRCVGDVSAGVEQLQFEIDKHLKGVMRQCWLDDEGGTSGADARAVCRFAGSITDLPSAPRYVALCSNTRGFVADSMGHVIRAEATSETCAPLPDPCVLVGLNENTVDYLLVLSFDGKVRLRLKSELNWKSRIFGLHCDDERQQLYVAQAEAVTVTDLCGVVKHVIRKADLPTEAGSICSVGMTADKVLVLTEQPNSLVGISKDSWEIELSVDFTCLKNFYGIRNLSAHKSKVLLSDQASKGKAQLLRLCSITGRLLKCYAVGSCPVQAVFADRGLLFLSESGTRALRIMTHDGTVVQTVDGHFSSPAGMALSKKSTPKKLLVADFGNKWLRFFDLQA